MKKYEAPKLETLEFTIADIIAVSLGELEPLEPIGPIGGLDDGDWG